jgi:hypothetical protein
MDLNTLNIAPRLDIPIFLAAFSPEGVAEVVSYLDKVRQKIRH